MTNKGLQPYLIPFFRRFILLIFVAAAAILLFSEIGFRLLREDVSRDPTTIELVVPKGTAERIAGGESNPTIPDDLVFIVGDVLVVRNEDVADHEFGPLWIPTGKSASLALDQANDYTYSCSFQPSNYLNLTVRNVINWRDRLGALWYGVPPTVMFLLVYSFVVKPLTPLEVRKPGMKKPA